MPISSLAKKIYLELMSRTTSHFDDNNLENTDLGWSSGHQPFNFLIKKVIRGVDIFGQHKVNYIIHMEDQALLVSWRQGMLRDISEATRGHGTEN